MKRLNFKRMSKEWLEWRSHGIGASDADTVMGNSKFGNTKMSLWEERTGKRLNKPANFQMRRGLKLEPEAREVYEGLTGISMPEAYGENETFNFFRASFDGLNTEAGRVLEIKCPGKDDHLTARAGNIPKHYQWQCVQLLLVSGLETVDYFSYRPGEREPSVIIPFSWNKALEDKLIQHGIEFWRCVLQNRSPVKRRSNGFNEESVVFPLRRSR